MTVRLFAPSTGGAPQDPSLTHDPAEPDGRWRIKRDRRGSLGFRLVKTPLRTPEAVEADYSPIAVGPAPSAPLLQLVGGLELKRLIGRTV